MIGHISTSRTITDLPFYQDDKCFKIFYHFLLKANFQEKNWNGKLIKRGQFVTSNNTLGMELGWSIQTVRTYVSKLEKYKEITKLSTTNYTLITVCNYEHYASCNNKTKASTNIMLTEHQQSTNKQVTTTKERKKEINKTQKLADRKGHDNNHYDKRQVQAAIENSYSTKPDQYNNINQEFNSYNDFLLSVEFIKDHLASFYHIDFKKYKYYDDRSVADALQKHLKNKSLYTKDKAIKSLKNQTDYESYLKDYFTNDHKDASVKRCKRHFKHLNENQPYKGADFEGGLLGYRLKVFDIVRPLLIEIHKTRYRKYKNLQIFTMFDVMIAKDLGFSNAPKLRKLDYYKSLDFDTLNNERCWNDLGNFLSNLEKTQSYKLNNTHIRRLIDDELEKNK
tara:strand:- start:2251 stop:3432 length:1182 start_codon:yes stop_codon:yes gene_type:complete